MDTAPHLAESPSDSVVEPVPFDVAPAAPRRGAFRTHAPWIGATLVAGCLGAYAFAARSYLASIRETSTVRGLKAAGKDIGGVAFDELPARLVALGEPALDERIAIAVGDDRVLVTRREAGFVVDATGITATAREIGRTGNPVQDVRDRGRALRGEIDLAIPFTIDRARALDFLTDLKELVDHAPVDAHLDLDHHGVAPERPGLLLAPYEGLAPLEQAAKNGLAKITLPTVQTPARVKQSDFAGIDISTVLATWETRYSTSALDSDRTYNLKVGASKLDGHVLKPGELFAFNEVVGDRTEKEGYRVAPVISSGELVDGLAGGMCQIASTLHAASFFAGLDIVSSTPHSRPSAYIPMGLDSTVVYPSTDLKLRNPFDFPVVMHYTVNQGAVKVELLGKRKVYNSVFEREILEEIQFGSELRKDKEAPLNQRYVAQEGYPGYRAVRRRYLFPADVQLPKSVNNSKDPLQKLIASKKVPEPVKVEKWSVHYPSTAEIDVVGAGPKKLKKKEAPPRHHIPAVPEDEKPIGRILR